MFISFLLKEKKITISITERIISSCWNKLVTIFVQLWQLLIQNVYIYLGNDLVLAISSCFMIVLFNNFIAIACKRLSWSNTNCRKKKSSGMVLNVLCRHVAVFNNAWIISWQVMQTILPLEFITVIKILRIIGAAGLSVSCRSVLCRCLMRTISITVLNQTWKIDLLNKHNCINHWLGAWSTCDPLCWSG